MGFQFALISHSRLTASAIWSHALLQVMFAATLLIVTIAVRPISSHFFGQTSGAILVVLAVTRLVIAVGATSRVLLERELRFYGARRREHAGIDSECRSRSRSRKTRVWHLGA